MPHEFIQQIFGWESADMVKVYDDTTFADKSWKELIKMQEEIDKMKSVPEENPPSE
jgi:hypothetical protein